jgi:O-antigen ligase
MRVPLPAISHSTGEAGAAQAEKPAPRWPYLVVLGLGLATVAAVQVGNGDLKIALVPSLLALLVWAVWVLPLRVPMLMLFALAWMLEAPGDAFAAGRVQTPWAVLGSLLWAKLDLVVPLPGLVFTGFDVLALLLFVVVAHRRHTGSTLDRAGWVNPPQPLGNFIWLSVAAVLWMSLFGLVRGGSFRFVLWQSIRWLYLPIVYSLMRQALRGAQDVKLVGKVVLAVGLFRAGEAIILREMFPSKEFLPHATSHHDSVLFTVCAAILLAMLLEMKGSFRFKLFALLMPIFIWAMYANNRRLVWAELLLVVVFFWLVTAWRPLKRKLARVLVLSALPLMLYTVVGWNAQGGVFGPVKKLRSMVDPEYDSSTRWRDMENFNLIYTFSLNPLFGSGFGHPMVESIPLPDVSTTYELEPYVPHNSVLGLWAFGGLVGFSLLWMVFPVGMFFTVRAYRWAGTPMERVTALGAAAAQICYLMQGFGDLGFGAWGPVFTVATSYALVGKICAANGGWRVTRRSNGRTLRSGRAATAGLSR